VGCPNAACSFCTFYRGRPFRILGDAEYRAHLEAVRDLFRSARTARDGIFLGSGSALSIPDPVLLDRLRLTCLVFGRPRRGLAAFHDPDHSPRRAGGDWARLRAAGLAEAHLGLETALPSLRAEAGKSPDLARFEAAVRDEKEAGLVMSVSVLVGLGGPARAAEHRDATVRFLLGLPLGPADRIYLSPLVPAGGGAVLVEEVGRWRADLVGRTRARVSDYRVERFAWLA
jgi:hypothetical protein